MDLSQHQVRGRSHDDRAQQTQPQVEDEYPPVGYSPDGRHRRDRRDRAGNQKGDRGARLHPLGEQAGDDGERANVVDVHGDADQRGQRHCPGVVRPKTAATAACGM